MVKFLTRHCDRTGENLTDGFCVELLKTLAYAFQEVSRRVRSAQRTESDSGRARIDIGKGLTNGGSSSKKPRP